jgi:hypothetical protein
VVVDVDPTLPVGASEAGPTLDLRDPVARELALGAVVALRALRLALQAPS